MALFKDVMELVQIEIYKDELHQDKVKKTKRQVFCDKRSISQREFFQAGQNGLAPEFVFIMRTHDYEGEQIIVYNNGKYAIYRTYAKEELIELYAQKKVGV